MRTWAVLTAGMTRFDRLDHSGIVAVQQVAFKVMSVFLVREDESAVFGIDPASSFNQSDNGISLSLE